MRTRAVPQAAPSAVRCAIYARQSVEERGRNGFGSIEAQREAGEKYVSLFEEKGWQTLPYRYEDGGFSGGTLERPALRQLRADIEQFAGEMALKDDLEGDEDLGLIAEPEEHLGLVDDERAEPPGAGSGEDNAGRR